MQICTDSGHHVDLSTCGSEPSWSLGTTRVCSYHLSLPYGYSYHGSQAVCRSAATKISGHLWVCSPYGLWVPWGLQPPTKVSEYPVSYSHSAAGVRTPWCCSLILRVSGYLFLNEFMAAGIVMQQNSALDNLGEQTGVPKEGELSPRKQKALGVRVCSLTRSVW